MNLSFKWKNLNLLIRIVNKVRIVFITVLVSLPTSTTYKKFEPIEFTDFKTVLDEDIVLLTKLVRAEADQSSDRDKLFIVQVVLNRKTPYESILDVLSAPNQFQGYLSKRWFEPLKMSDYNLIDSFLQTGKKLHNYHSFLNPFIATNKSYRDYAVKQRGEWVGKHWYWEEK